MTSNGKLLVVLLSVGAFAGIGLCIAAGVGIFYWQFAVDILKPEDPPRPQEVAQDEAIEIEDMKVQFMGHQINQRTLMIDSINRGTQFEKRPPGVIGRDDPSRLPTMYCHSAGPVGLALRPPSGKTMTDTYPFASIPMFAAHAPFGSPWPVCRVVATDAPIAVVTMDAGTLAAYARPFQHVDFYERSPAIQKLSLPNGADRPKFTYIEDAKARGANIRIFSGNERATFDKQAPEKFYQYIFVETSRGNSDNVFKELLTQEAMKRYLASLTENGTICFHTSCRNYDLSSIVASVAASLDCQHVAVNDQSQDMPARASCMWVFVARRAEYLDAFSKNSVQAFLAQHPRRPQSFQVSTEPFRADLVWRDGAANSLDAVRVRK